MRVAALVAAAGRSERMGRCKALLPLGSTTFVAQLCRVFSRAGCDPVVVTAPEGPSGELVRGALAELSARVVDNAFMEQGLSGSVRTALAEAPEVDALLLCPVDMPFVTPALVRKLVAALEAETEAAAAVPVVDGARGHPVLLGRALFADLAKADELGGPRGVLAAKAASVREVAWGDPRVLVNVNTPEVFERVMGGEES
jgi:molybdenum cofactor cytidylyltransferase